jgi:hypothetical protein
MAFSDTLKREIEVAFSKHSQPVWFRVLKYILLAGFLYFFWGNKYLLPGFLIFLVFAIALHFWYRYKTQGWTKSYGMWKYHKSKYDTGTK